MRPTTAIIDLAAVCHNLGQVKRRAAGAKVVAVVKAHGYGHGAARILPALSGADMLGVACIEEALDLRESGAVQPMLLLEGVFEADELPWCAWLNLEIAVHEPGQVRMLDRARLERPLTVWLKLDTGMNRLGFRPEAVLEAYRQLKDCPAVAEIRLMSHFASADEPDDPSTREQIRRFAATGGDLGVQRSFCNSAGVLAWPQAHAEWVRPGVMLYGISPLAGRTGLDEELRPAMTLRTSLIAVKEVRCGERVGYGGTWQARADTRIGVAAIGYGDGYPRHAPTGTPVLVNGRPATLPGRVSINMLTIDLGSQPDAKIGDPVVLWGDGLPAETVAAHAGTIAYELLCGVPGRAHVQLQEVGERASWEGAPRRSEWLRPMGARAALPSRRQHE